MRVVKMLSVVAFVLAANVGEAKEPQWEVASQSGPVTVYTRSFQGSNYLGFLGVTTVDRPVGDVVAYFEDFGRHKEWMPPRTMDVRKVRDDVAGPIVYMKFDIPTPLKDRDAVIAYRKSIKPDGSVEMAFDAKSGIVAEKGGVVRMPKISGAWTFRPTGPQTTEIRYQQHQEPGGMIPSFMANQMVVDTPAVSLAQMRQKLLRR